MKINRSLIKHNWKRALGFLLNDRNSLYRPLLVVRQDDPHHGYRIWQYFLSKKGCIYVRLGISCSMFYLYQEILLQLKCNISGVKSNYHDNAVELIIAKIKAKRDPVTIAIDNCHHFLSGQIFFLLGLMNELEGRVKFVFLLEEGCLKNYWLNDAKGIDPRLRFFLSKVQRKYAISY